MARNARVDVGGEIYHVINRAVGRAQIFTTPHDYQVFMDLLTEAKELVGMRILAFTLMPNHWHLVLYPRADGDMGRFMHQLTNAHTRRVHADTGTNGMGPLYQGRYKSFLVQGDRHLLTLIKYVERNPVRARLVKRCENWRWGSAWLRARGLTHLSLIDEPATPLPTNYVEWINTQEKDDDLVQMRDSVKKGKPFGKELWVEKMVKKFELESSLRNPGRPKSK